jgi:hydroxyacylglutathione hydrolase
MYANMQRIAALPEDVRIYCGHEYTLANARFALHAEAGNAEIARRLEQVTEMRERGEITLPTSVGEELATNPFVRASSVQELARLRTEKDSFR